MKVVPATTSRTKSIVRDASLFANRLLIKNDDGIVFLAKCFQHK